MTPVRDAIETYLYTVASLSKNTLYTYKGRLAVFQEFCDANDYFLEQITPKVFRDFADHIASRPDKTGDPSRLVGKTTISAYTRVVKIFLNWTTTYDDYIGCVKPASLRAMRVPKRDKKILPVLTQEEIARLYDACKQSPRKYTEVRDRAIVSVLIDSGLRASEICSLKIGSVQLKDYTDPHINITGKGNKEREPGLGQRARLDLHRFIQKYRRGAKPDEFVFLSFKRKPMTRTEIYQIINKLKCLAGIEKDGGPHMLRRTFATIYMDNGGDIYDLQELMGHENITTTEGYIQNVRQRQARRRSRSVLDSLS